MQEWLRLARHQAVDSDLPDSDTVRESCLDDVGRCDLYVLIVGHRYGFQPAEDNPEGRPITQLEFRRAEAAFRGWRCCGPASPMCACRIRSTRHGRRWCLAFRDQAAGLSARGSSAICRG